jgi:tRNA-2-methylthio-N6-dimethylallyladenosine synthase
MTKAVMREVEYEGAYMFNYSPRPNTKAFDTLSDDVSLEEKTRRLNEIIALQNEVSAGKNLLEIGNEYTILVEGRSKRNETEWKGRTDTNKTVIFSRDDAEVGEYRRVRVTRSSSATLFGKLTDAKKLRNSTHLGHDRGDILFDSSPHITGKESSSQPEILLPIISN